jgi:hypothetical protein
LFQGWGRHARRGVAVLKMAASLREDVVLKEQCYFKVEAADYLPGPFPHTSRPSLLPPLLVVLLVENSRVGRVGMNRDKEASSVCVQSTRAPTH